MSRRRFPPWTTAARDERGRPITPLWQAADLAARGGRFEAVVVREPKAAHGRQEVRQLWTLADPALNAYVGCTGTRGTAWPLVQQVVRVERWRQLRQGGQVVKREHEVAYAITSVRPARAGASQLLRWLRGHWRIENRLHYVRDVTLGEDAAQIRTAAAPQVVAACRNLVLTLLRQAGYTNIAAALRTLSARPPHAVALVLQPLPLLK